MKEHIDEMTKVLVDYTNKNHIMASHVILEDYAEALYSAGYRKIPENIGEFSDGYHTFNELYHHRAVLFSAICNMFPEKAWKSKLHDTGDMYDGMFIVGIETEQGQATYHYDIEPYWDMFKVKELDKAPKYDGHTPSDAIERIGNLPCAGYRKQKSEVERLNKELDELAEEHSDLIIEKDKLFDIAEKQKVEIEALKDEANRYKRYYFHHDYDKMIAEAKSEVAREIFEELVREVYSKIPDKILPVTFGEMSRHLDYNDGLNFGSRNAYFDTLKIIAELQKKYI